MCIVVTIKDGKEVKLETEFHVPFTQDKVKDLVKIVSKGNLDVEIFASGDEYEAIRQVIRNIPFKDGYFCSWTGESAKFILNNLV